MSSQGSSDVLTGGNSGALSKLGLYGSALCSMALFSPNRYFFPPAQSKEKLRAPDTQNFRLQEPPF